LNYLQILLFRENGYIHKKPTDWNPWALIFTVADD